MITKYIEQKSVAYRKMNAARKNSTEMISLSVIVDSLSDIERWAIALDTFDYMYVESGSFATWYRSEYARIVMQELETLLGMVIETASRISQVRTVCVVERAIDSSIKVLQELPCEVDDVLVIDLLQQFNSVYLSRRSEFMAIMSEWFEAQA